MATAMTTKVTGTAGAATEPEARGPVVPEPIERSAHLAAVPDGSLGVTTDVSAAEPDESEFRSFGLAIVLGVALGIPVLGALVAAGVWLAAPDTDPMAIAGTALWVGLFCGPFLAGTVTVGVWSSRHH